MFHEAHQTQLAKINENYLRSFKVFRFIKFASKDIRFMLLFIKLTRLTRDPFNQHKNLQGYYI